MRFSKTYLRILLKTIFKIIFAIMLAKIGVNPATKITAKLTAEEWIGLRQSFRFNSKQHVQSVVASCIPLRAHV